MSKYGLTRYIICLYVVNIWQSAAMQFVAKKGRNLCNLWLDKMALPPHSCLSTSVFILKFLVWSIFHRGLRSLPDTFNSSINNSTNSNFVSIVIIWNMTSCLGPSINDAMSDFLAYFLTYLLLSEFVLVKTFNFTILCPRFWQNHLPTPKLDIIYGCPLSLIFLVVLWNSSEFQRVP